MKSEALLALTLLSACVDKGNDTGSAVSDKMTAQVCLDQIDSARTATDLLLTDVWEDGETVYWTLDTSVNSDLNAGLNDVRCFVNYGGDTDVEAQRSGTAWTTPKGAGQIDMGCAVACDEWLKIADCTGGFGCDTPGTEQGSTVVTISE